MDDNLKNNPGPKYSKEYQAALDHHVAKISAQMDHEFIHGTPEAAADEINALLNPPQMPSAPRQVSIDPPTQDDVERMKKWMGNCTVVVNNHALAAQMRAGTLSQERFNDVCKLFELNGYDYATVHFTLSVDTSQVNEMEFLNEHPFANRKQRRAANKLQKKANRKR